MKPTEVAEQALRDVSAAIARLKAQHSGPYLDQSTVGLTLISLRGCQEELQSLAARS